MLAGVFLVSAAVLLVSFRVAYDLQAADSRQQEYEQEINEIKNRIQGLNVSLEGLRHERTTLQAVLSNLDNQIASLQSLILQSKNLVASLETEIGQLQQEIVAQKEILRHIIVLLYERSGASSLELLIVADSFSDYLNDQEYLNRLQAGMSRSLTQIQKLQSDLELDKQQQESLLEGLQAQEVSLAALRWEKANLLAVTLNEEQRFQSHLQTLRSEQRRLEAELEKYLASLLQTQTSLGRVTAGTVIGRNGNTGWSTGPHLHLVIYSPGIQHYDPLAYIRNNGLLWPMGGSGGWVSQGFHANHKALDIAAREGTPVVAVADGEMIHRGCLYGGDYRTFGIIINHGKFIAIYVHLQAPNNPQYTSCSINRRSSYGTPSIDYLTTE